MLSSRSPSALPTYGPFTFVITLQFNKRNITMYSHNRHNNHNDSGKQSSRRVYHQNWELLTLTLLSTSQVTYALKVRLAPSMPELLSSRTRYLPMHVTR